MSSSPDVEKLESGVASVKSREVNEIEHGGLPTVALLPDPTEGGWRGWIVVFGASLCLFLSFGFINAFSVFEVYYQNTLKSDSSASDIAWIGSVQLFTICSSSLFIGQLFDRLGPRLLLAFVTLLYPFSCMMNSLATTYWQIFLCQGLLQGISIAITYAVPISCIPQWFNKKRGLATAVVVTGSSLGGILWPVIVLHLLNKVGYGWTWRIIGFMALAILVIATMTVSQRNESSWTALLHTSRQLHESKRQKKPFFYLEAFQSRPYRLLCVAMFFSWFGLFYTFFYLSSWGASYGLSQSLQFYSTSILNAASCFGRIIPGLLADRFGALNIIFFCTILSAIVTLCSLVVNGPAGVLIIGGFYGLASGGLISLIVPCIAKSIRDLSRMGTALGQLSSICAIPALLGPPVAGWIINSKSNGVPFWHGAQAFSAACLLCTAIFLAACRFALSSNLLARV